MTDAVPQSPFTIDRELLDGNLEAKRKEGLCCPHCSQTMEWNLGPKTKGEILNTISRRALHETFIRCDKDECPSVHEGARAPILRRISAAADGNITVSTLRLEDILNELRVLRDGNNCLRARATIQVEMANQRAREEIETLRAEMQRQLDEALGTVNELGEQIGLESQRINGLAEEIERLKSVIAEIDRIAEVKKPEDRLAVIRDLAQAATAMNKVCRLTNLTPLQVLANAHTWAAQHGRR